MRLGGDEVLEFGCLVVFRRGKEGERIEMRWRER